MLLRKPDLVKFKEILLAKRAVTVGDATRLEDEAVRKSKDEAATMDISNFADLGTDNYEQEFDLGLLEHQGETLREIDEALERVANGTYGICTTCGKPIPKGRLMAKPHARYCIPCLTEQEESGS